MAGADRGRVDGVVEVGVADEHADDLGAAAVARLQMALDQLLARQRDLAQQQLAQAHARDVRVDEQRRALVGEAVAGDAEPGDLQAGRERQPAGARLQLVERGALLGGLGRAAHLRGAPKDIRASGSTTAR